MARPFGPGLSSWDAPRAHGGKGHEDELTIARGSLAHWDIQNLPYKKSAVLEPNSNSFDYLNK